MVRAERLSLPQARLIALAAQGLAGGRPDSGPGARAVTATARRLGVIQIDAVNVLARAHLMPLYSRLGPYDVGLLERLTASSPRRLVEAWAHEASFIPVETWPLLGWRRAAAREWPPRVTVDAIAHHPDIVEHVLDLLGEHGPLTAKETHLALVAAERSSTVRRDTGWGSWSAAKAVLEYLFRGGAVSPAGRTPQFERRFDLTERVVPAPVLAALEPDRAAAHRELIAIAARAHGIATQRDLADYFRLGGPRGKEKVAAAISDLVDDGVLTVVEVVDGRDVVPGPWYLYRDAVLPRASRGRALLSPFDPLVFERRRLAALFGVDYRLEIYTPEHKRVHGYYVLLFLDGDRITARVDLKAERASGTMLVRAAHVEASVSPADVSVVAAHLAEELRTMAGWLGLERIAVEQVGSLAQELRRASKRIS